jgi:tetratricopeptide (TPR) repeat protein
MWSRLKYSNILFGVLLAACGRPAQDYLARGDKFFEAGKYADAELNYSKAIQKDPSFGDAYYKLGTALVKEDKGFEARDALQRAAELLPDHIETKVALADVAFAFYLRDSKRPQILYDQITRLSAQILAIRPDSPDGFRLQGAMQLLDGKLTAAVKSYQTANELRPGDGSIVLGYAQSLSQSGRAGDAEEAALAFLEKNANSPLLYDFLYREYMAANRTADAERLVNRWIEKNPNDATAVLRLAGYYASLQKTSEVDATLRLLDKAADYPLGPMHAGDFYAGSGNWPEATAQYERGLQADAKNATAYRKKIAGALLAQGKQQEAAAMLEATIKQAPDDSEPRIMRARLWLETGKRENLDAALADLQRLLKDYPEDVDVNHELGRAYLLKGDAVSARTRFLEAARWKKDFLAPRYELVQLAINQQNSGDALRIAEEILEIKPGDARGRLARASALIGAKRYPEARAELRQLSKDYPQYRDAQIQTGLLAIQEKNFKEAEEVFRKLGETKADDVRPAVGLASVYASQKQFDRAIQLLSEESKKTPPSATVLNVLAVISLQAGKYPLAIDSFQRVVTANRSSFDAHLNLAEAYLVSGDSEKGAAELEKAQQLGDKNPASMMTLAAAFYSAGRPQESKDVLRRVVQLQPGNASALNNLAFLIMETGGDLDEAQRLAQQAVQKDGNDPHNQDTLGWVYFKKNVTDRGLAIFRHLVQKNQDDPTYRYHLGAALLRNGEKEQARTELLAALARKPQQGVEKSIRELLSGLN